MVKSKLKKKSSANSQKVAAIGKSQDEKQKKFKTFIQEFVLWVSAFVMSVTTFPIGIKFFYFTGWINHHNYTPPFGIMIILIIISLIFFALPLYHLIRNAENIWSEILKIILFSIIAILSIISSYVITIDEIKSQDTMMRQVEAIYNTLSAQGMVSPLLQ